MGESKSGDQGCVILLSVLRSAKWLPLWRRLTPLWISLWLLSSFGGPAAAWQHLDGTLCNTCTFAAPVFDPCCDEAQPHAAMGLSAPDDCQQCCAPAPQHAPDKLLSPLSHAAILSAPIAFAPPVRRETRLFFAPAASPVNAFPRPPPRGRAPPFLFSTSPF